MKEIKLSKGFCTIVDDEDFNMLNNIEWHVNDSTPHLPYAEAMIRMGQKQRCVKMHRFILQPPAGFVVDHINHNSLDNRKENLRVCSHKENMRNSRPYKNNSNKFKGVRFNKKSKKYYASIVVDGKPIHLGTFEKEMDAVIARDKAAREYHGEYAFINLNPTNIV